MKISKKYLHQIIAEEAKIVLKKALKEEPAVAPLQIPRVGPGITARSGAIGHPLYNQGALSQAAKDAGQQQLTSLLASNPQASQAEKERAFMAGVAAAGAQSLAQPRPAAPAPVAPTPTPTPTPVAPTPAPVPKPAKPVDRSGMTPEATAVTKQIQQKLIAAKLLPAGKDDGLYGKDTTAAVAKWFAANPTVKRPGGRNFLEAIKNILTAMGSVAATPPVKDHTETPPTQPPPQDGQPPKDGTQPPQPPKDETQPPVAEETPPISQQNLAPILSVLTDRLTGWVSEADLIDVDKMLQPYYSDPAAIRQISKALSQDNSFGQDLKDGLFISATGDAAAIRDAIRNKIRPALGENKIKVSKKYLEQILKEETTKVLAEISLRN